MAKIHGGELAVEIFKKEGVKFVFELCGGHIDPISQACLDAGIRIIDTRHEMNAAFAADGWARATGKPTVAMATAGPGVTNATTGIWNAYGCRSPMVFFGGKHPLTEYDIGSLQDMDSMALEEGITKWRRACYETRRIPEYFGMAFRQATSGQPGPVFLESPWDILGGEIDEEKAVRVDNYRTTARAQGDPDMIKKAVEMLLKAKRPLIVAGSGVWWSQASKELREFIEMYKVPLVLSQMSRGSVPEDHPYCFGPTRVGTRTADVVMLIGGRLTYALNFGRPGLFSYDQKWIQVDIEATEIGKNRPIDIGIVGDAKMVLQQMMDEGRDRTKGRKESDWLKECQAYLKGRGEKMEVFTNSDERPIHPARLCKEIRDFVDRDATIIMDGGEITIWGGATLKVYEPGHWMDNGPTGCLGPGMGFAMAAKLARPNTQVLELTGDGTFGINGIEIETMVRHNIPAVSVIANDGAWTMIKKLQEVQGPNRIIGTTLKEGTRYDKMAEALGAYAELVEKPEDIRPALQRAFASGRPAVLNVITKSIPRTSPTMNVGTTPGGDPLPFIL